MVRWRQVREWFSVRAGEEWIELGRTDDFPVESVRVVEARGVPVAVFHLPEGFRAIGDVCPHMGASLSDGTLHKGELVECPAHRLRFSLTTGRCAENHPYQARVFAVRVHDGRLFLRV